MKYLILLSILLSGCAWQTADSVDIKTAEYLCKGEISSISVHWNNYVTAVCANRTRLVVSGKIIGE